MVRRKKTSGPLSETIPEIVNQTPVLDVHTHLYDTHFDKLLLWGIDELLTYHYLIAEVFIVAPLPYDKFWAMTKKNCCFSIIKYLLKTL